jgi:hypothetical protein
MMILWHRTSHVSATSILTGGFHDAHGRYMTDRDFFGVWLSDRPLDENEGACGDAVLRVVLHCNESDVQGFEWIEEGKNYREWLIPAALLNGRAEVTLVDV